MLKYTLAITGLFAFTCGCIAFFEGNTLAGVAFLVAALLGTAGALEVDHEQRG